MYVVIMAGGGGTRLWPLSSPERPKPFLRLFEEGTLFQRSVGRVVGPELGLGPADVTVVAAGAYAALAREQAPGVGAARGAGWVGTRPPRSPWRRWPSSGPTTR